MADEAPRLSFDDVDLLSERQLGTLGRVFIVRRGEGAPAEVPDPWLGLSTLALRPLVAEGNESEEAVARLRADAEALAGLEHPSLLRVVGIGRRRDAELVAVECPPAPPKGSDLAALIARRDLPLAGAVALARECAAALGMIASESRFHADFVTSCVFVPGPSSTGGDSGKGAKVLPLALPPDYRVEHRASPLAFYRGSPAHAAPELHADAGRNPTEKSNIFAFGVAFYEMLTAQPPFRGGTPTRMLVDIREGSPSPPSVHVKDLPEDLERICMRCLEKDPERRFPNFASLESSLRIAEDSLDPTAAGASTRQLAVPSEQQDTPDLAAPPPGQQPAAQPTAAVRTSGRTSARQARLATRQIAIFVAAAVVATAAAILVLVSAMRSPAELPARTKAAYDVVGRAEDLIAGGRPEEAKLLLESHADAREVDADAYDRVIRKAKLRQIEKLARAAYNAGRWAAALEGYDALMDQGEGGDRLKTRRDAAAYRAGLKAAELAAAADDWGGAAKALEEVSVLITRAAGRNWDPDRARRDLKLARLIKRADVARAEGGEASERELLFEALRLCAEGAAEPDGPARRDFDELSRAAAEARLARISAGPEASREALIASRAALEAGDLDGAERWALEARDRWPDGAEPGALLAYVSDHRFCEEAGMALVSRHAPRETWGVAERRASFCIDRYEYPGKPGELPVRGVSAVEAAAMCAKRGGRLCALREWRLACGGPEGLAYPYGNKYARETCNAAGAALAPSGSRPDCRSTFGAYDMSGNVAEWTAEFAGGAQLVAGGDWSGGEAFTRCDTAARFNPGLTSPRVGLRCCRSLPEPEND